MTCLIRGFMGFSFLESWGCYILGTRRLGEICETCQDNFGTERRTGAAALKFGNYSVRNAVMGVTRVARCAGKKQASNEAPASITLDVMSANGSLGLTS